MLKRVDLRCDSVPFLDDSDECYYFLDYISGGYSESESNSIVLNFKKDLVYKGQPAWFYREEAIKFFSSKINEVLERMPNRHRFILMPCPTSKPKNHPDFNDRLLCVAEILAQSNRVYDRLDRTQEVVPVHQGGTRNIDNIMKTMTISTPLLLNEEDIIILFDDVLTAGAHFKACQKMIMEKWGIQQENIIGLFLAKTCHVVPKIQDINDISQ